MNGSFFTDADLQFDLAELGQFWRLPKNTKPLLGIGQRARASARAQCLPVQIIRQSLPRTCTRHRLCFQVVPHRAHPPIAPIQRLYFF